MKIFATAITLVLMGCTSVPQMNVAVDRVDQTWADEYLATEKPYRVRQVSAPQETVAAAVRATFDDLGLKLDPERAPDTLSASNKLPAHLTSAEWAQVQDAENPRLKDTGGRRLRLLNDSGRYLVNLKASAKPAGAATTVRIDYAMEGPAIGAIEPTHNAPPLVVQFASGRFWQALDKRLAASGLPASTAP